MQRYSRLAEHGEASRIAFRIPFERFEPFEPELRSLDAAEGSREDQRTNTSIKTNARE